jgi:hypothetical protein
VKIDIKSRKKLHITVDFDDNEAHEFCDAVSDAFEQVRNWNGSVKTLTAMRAAIERELQP